MEIKNLANTNIETIVECLAKSFQNYFVKMPTEVDFWVRRFNTARVDYKLSFGIFDDGILVAFIIHGIDIHNDEITAFNTGTGVLKAYRGQKLIDRIYNFAIPILKENGIKKCILEVIEQNHVAIRLYERIGFKKDRFLRCFKGESIVSENRVLVEEIDIAQLKDSIEKYQKYYSWDNALNTILKGGKIFKSFIVNSIEKSEIGYFIINTNNNTLIQIESYDDQNWTQMIGATKNIISPLRINNIDSNRVECVNALLHAALQNHINQFDMILRI